MTTLPAHLQRLLENIKAAGWSGVTFHPEDPHTPAITELATELGLQPVPSRGLEYRRVRGCHAPAPMPVAVGTGRKRLPAEPPPGVMAHTAWDDRVWRKGGTDGEWLSAAPGGGTDSVRWETIAAGKYGPVSWLVPLPAAAEVGEPHEQLGALLDGLMTPVIEAMEHLGAAAVAGMRVLLGEAVRRGEAVHVERVVDSPQRGVDRLIDEIRRAQNEERPGA